MKEPTSWIKKECILDGFEWKDPSEIQKEAVFCLLDHWRAHQAQGLEPLIWVPTCPLFKDAEKTAKHVWAIRQAKALQPPPDSDEEVFVLPSSDDIDLEEEDGQDDHGHSGQSSSPHDLSDDGQAMSADSPGSDVHMGYSEDRIIGGSYIVCCMV